MTGENFHFTGQKNLEINSGKFWVICFQIKEDFQDGEGNKEKEEILWQFSG